MSPLNPRSMWLFASEVSTDYYSLFLWFELLLRVHGAVWVMNDARQSDLLDLDVDAGRGHSPIFCLLPLSTSNDAPFILAIITESALLIRQVRVCLDIAQ